MYIRVLEDLRQDLKSLISIIMGRFIIFLRKVSNSETKRDKSNSINARGDDSPEIECCN